VFVKTQDEIVDVVKIMRDKNISSVLVTDESDEVVGIVTERDIVQKFTLLENQNKLNAKVVAFMTRPVHFAKLASLEHDVRQLFLEHRIRHFPVIATVTKAQDVLGMLTVTDISRAYFRHKPSLTSHSSDERDSVIAIIAKKNSYQHYEQLFKTLHFQIQGNGTDGQIIKGALTQNIPVLADIDGYSVEETKALLTQLKNLSGPLLLLSSQSELVHGLKKHLTGANRYIAMKPLDITSILEIIDRIEP
jgi:CBS domain-containing protein